jgi:hypothetical protein
MMEEQRRIQELEKSVKELETSPDAAAEKLKTVSSMS